MNRSQILKLIVSIILPLAIGSIAGTFTSQAIPGWYANLEQPSFNPPNWVFAPVWTTLYIIMGISLFLVWKQDANKDRNIAIAIFLIHLILNFLWSFLFFYFKWIGVAFLEIVLLWISIVVMLTSFFKVNKMAAYINIPYLVWVSFATVLNGSYYFLNKPGEIN